MPVEAERSASGQPTDEAAAQRAAQQRDALAERLFRSNMALLDVLTVYLGDRLGLYRALTESGPVSPRALAARTGTDERYVREWLEQQTVTGFLAVDDPGLDPGDRRYTLPGGHAEVLTDRDSLSYLPPLGRFHLGVGQRLPELLAAFRTGAGLAYLDYCADAREGQADVNRTMFINMLAQEWLPAVPDAHARLQADPPARVADIGCGTGWSSVALARAYPQVRVDGFDSDGPSIELARANAAAAGVADRVAFHRRDASDLALAGNYELVTAFECVHDMGRPVEALRAMGRLANPRGAVLVADERVAEQFGAFGDAAERLVYAWSVLFCLPTGLADAPSVGTGAVMRVATLRAYAAEAGFRGVEILPIENDFWRFYRLLL
jgi:SAM-dependent methyltransferase